MHLLGTRLKSSGTPNREFVNRLFTEDHGFVNRALTC
ncbi:MAG: hypothetical protein ACI85J_001104 [Candidatus Poriferisodalaceae bacterium]|jgi:hypothetical protein